MKIVLFIFSACLAFTGHGVIRPAKPAKVALIIAVGDYPAASGWETLSAHNDARILKDALVKKGFDSINITLLQDRQATRQGILRAIRVYLTDRVKNGDVAFFHFSGHGQQVQDQQPGDEVDGYDEAIVPYDSPLHIQPGVYEGENLIRDEELGVLLNEVRVKLGSTGHLLTLIDACHSGTATRGAARARGTHVRMASPEYIAGHQGKIEKGNTLARETPDAKGLAPMVAFFSAAPNQLSYEYVDNSDEGYGILSYTFSKAFGQAEAGATYQILFDQIRLHVSALSPWQTPQAEGVLHAEIFGGKFTGVPRYFLPEKKDWIDNKTVKLNAGTLNGFYENTRMAFYPANTADTAGIRPLAYGTITYTDMISCDVELKQLLPENNRACKVFIRERNYGSLSASLHLEVPPGPLADALQRLPAECPAIRLAGTNSELTLRSIGSGEKLVLVSRDGFTLDTFDLPTTGNYRGLLRETRENVVAFAQAKFLRPLEIEDARLNIALELLTPAGRPIRLDEQTVLHVGEEIRIRVRNTGSAPCYFSVLDLPPDNRMGMVIPFDKPAIDYYLLPGAFYDFEEIIPITGPTGTEVLKLIASEQPLDLSGIIASRSEGNTGSHPLEVLLRETYLLHDSKRGGATSNMPGGGVTVRTMVLEIRE